MPYDEDNKDAAHRQHAVHYRVENSRAPKAYDKEEDEVDQKYNLLPAGVYAAIMGRHLIDPHTAAVRFDWPGVRLSFHVKGTTFVSIRIQTAGSVFGYRVYPVTELGDKLEPMSPQKHYEPQNPKKHQQQTSSSPEMLLGGPGLFGGGKVVNEYALAVGLDPFLHYKIDIWKRDDPTGSVCIIEGLYVDKPHGMGVLQQQQLYDDNNNNNNNGGDEIVNSRIDKLSPLHAALQAQQQQQQQQSIHNPSKMKKKKPLNLEFVGNSDSVGFGNLTTFSSKLYYTLCQSSCIPLFRRLYEGTDVTQSWPAFLCAALGNANYSVVAWSGVGAKYSMSTQESMTLLYSRVIACEAKSQIETDDDPYNTDDSTADSSGGGTYNNKGKAKNGGGSLGPADAVLVYIGQNDKVRMANHRASNTLLSNGYEELLLLIRQHRPLPIPIIVIVPTLNAAVTGVATESKRLETCAIQHELWSYLVLYKLGGPAAGFYLVENSHMPAIFSKADYSMNLHWNVDSHRRWARGLEPQIRDILLQQPPAVLVQEQPQQELQQERGINVKDSNNIDDDIPSKTESSVLATSTPANAMIAACALPFSCLAPEYES